MSNIVKSIFRQREVEKIYEIKEHKSKYSTYSGYLDKEINIIDATINVRENTGNLISDKEIGRYDVEIPMLEIGDTFFLHDIQEVVIITSRMRSSDGSITYYVQDKIVETENTKLTKEKCDKTMMEFKEIRDMYRKYVDKYKYKHRFFNIKCADKAFQPQIQLFVR